jgi:hypothetical protein
MTECYVAITFCGEEFVSKIRVSIPCKLLAISNDPYLTHEASFTVFKDNKLERLVKETVAAISVPAGARNLITGDRARVIQADQEDRGLDLAEELLVVRTSVDEGLASL